jgi:hypothetical protein
MQYKQGVNFRFRLLSSYYKEAVFIVSYSKNQTIPRKLQSNPIIILDMVEEYSPSSKIADPLEEDGTCHSRALKQCCCASNLILATFC